MHYGGSSISLVFSFSADILPPRRNILLRRACVHVRISEVKQEQMPLSALMRCTVGCTTEQVFFPTLFPVALPKDTQNASGLRQRSITVLIGNRYPFVQNNAEKQS